MITDLENPFFVPISTAAFRHRVDQSSVFPNCIGFGNESLREVGASRPLKERGYFFLSAVEYRSVGDVLSSAVVFIII